jgi:hypothetical protein
MLSVPNDTIFRLYRTRYETDDSISSCVCYQVVADIAMSLISNNQFSVDFLVITSIRMCLASGHNEANVMLMVELIITFTNFGA